MKRRVPRLRTDQEAEAFLESDLADLDFSQFKSGRLLFEDRPAFAHPSEHLGHSEAYCLFEQAMIEQKQIVCVYHGVRREICPVLLGHRQGEEKALTFQLADRANPALPPSGEWRCLNLSEVSQIELRDGPLLSGKGHSRPSRCVTEVDLDVNPKSPYHPKRNLQQLRTAFAEPSPQPARVEQS